MSVSSTRQSPVPPPQSPLIKLGEERLKSQLDLEEQLRATAEELLDVYRSSRQWRQVSQLAQALTSNSGRITCIKDCLSSLNVFKLPPPATPPSLPGEPPQDQFLLLGRSESPIDSPAAEKMTTEEPHDESLSVKLLENGETTCESRDKGSCQPCWEIRSKVYTNGEPVRRSADDVSSLLSHLLKDVNLLKENDDPNGTESPDALREILVAHLDDNALEDIPPLLQSFLSPSVNNFSVVACDTESLSSQLSEKKIVEPTSDVQPHSCVQNTEDDVHTHSSEADPQTHSNEADSQIHTGEADPQTHSNGADPQIRSSEADPLTHSNEADAQTYSGEADPQTQPSTADPQTHSSDVDPHSQSSDADPQTHSSETDLQTHSDDQTHSSALNESESVDRPSFDSQSHSSENQDEVVKSNNIQLANDSQSDSELITADQEISPNHTETEHKHQDRNEPVTASEHQDRNEPVSASEDNQNREKSQISSDAIEEDSSIKTTEESVLESKADTAPQTVNNLDDGTSVDDSTIPLATDQVDGEEKIVEPVVPEVLVKSKPNADGAEVPSPVGGAEVPPPVGGAEVPPPVDTDEPIITDVNKTVSPMKHGILITSASGLFVKSAADDEFSPMETTPIMSDTETPTDISSSEGILSRSDDYSNDKRLSNTEKVHSSEPDKSNQHSKPPSGRPINPDTTASSTTGRSTFFAEAENSTESSHKSVTPDPTTSGGEEGGKSTFFMDKGHTTETNVAEKRTDSPKNMRRGKAHSVFYSSRSSASPPPDQDKGKLSTKLKRSFKRTNKIKKEVSVAEGTVSLMAPQLATSWDPTCILEELYSDCHPVVPQSSSSGESCRYAGYLDKLPVNQSKPAVMKGWKHRYFRVTRGSLFYYDDEKSQKAISFVRLTDAKIVLHPESLKVEINEKNGNFIFLRAETKTEAQALQRALQLESVHPTLAQRLLLSPSVTTPTVIIDLGSCSVRAGLLSDHDNYPQLFFPNVCAFNSITLVACGNDSLLPNNRGASKLVYPRRHRTRMDSTISIRECYTAIIEDICKKLDIKPEKCNLLVSISPIMPEMEQQILAEVVLETLGFQGLLMQEQTTLALYSYNCTTGISVNVGDSISVVPIIDGYKVEGADHHVPLGGMNVTESLSKLAASRDIRYFSETEMYIVRHVKESLCFVSQEYFDDAEKCEDSPHEYTRAVDVDRFQLPDHKKVIALDLALFKAPEGLFQPAIWGKDVPGIHETVHKAIEQCPIDVRREMCRHIYLSGGTTLMVGFPERLKFELSKLMPRTEIVIHADENRHHSAYLGATILASLNAFQKSLITQDDWISEGFDAFRKNDRS